MDGFNTFEKQDKILLGENNSPEAAAAALILRQQGFAVQPFAADAPADTAALLAALAEKAAELDCAFIATGHFARTETDADGVCRILPAVDGTWIHFDYVPEEYNVRTGSADITGKLCVIGSKLDEAAIAQLFGV